MKKSTEHKQCKRDNKIGDYLTSLRSSCKQMQVVHADLPPYVSHQVSYILALLCKIGRIRFFDCSEFERFMEIYLGKSKTRFV